MATEDYDHLIKIVMVGDSGCGKSCLLSQYTRGEFLQESKSTIGVEFATKNVNIYKNGDNFVTNPLNETDNLVSVIKFQIWDTAGQERYRAITSAYYRNALVVILVYDITKHESYERALNYWMKEVKQHTLDNTIIALVGNKIDLRHLRNVDKTESQKNATKLNLLFFEISSKDGTNVNALFETIALDIYKIIQESDPPQTIEPAPIYKSKSIQIKLQPDIKKSNCC
jgi:Ras-related protein Rab-11A